MGNVFAIRLTYLERRVRGLWLPCAAALVHMNAMEQSAHKPSPTDRHQIDAYERSQAHLFTARSEPDPVPS